MIGTAVGSYRITHKLAEGGMGEVYVANHDMMDREVVVKVLLPDLSLRTDMVKRFFNEARAAASIQHPGIVDVFDMGYAEDGRAYIVMEKLRGETLAARVAREQLAPSKAAQVVRQLASALAAAHGRGIVHRDLKPDNVFLVPDPEVTGGERVKVLDFGIAKLAMKKSGSLVTAAGAVFGTPAYMAPEQCSDAATVDQRADVYALGCILYECLTSQPPFGHGGLELLAAHLRDEPEPPSTHNPEVPEDLDAITLQLLAKDPAHRFQTCSALADALRPYAGSLPGGYPSRQRTAAVGYAPTIDTGTPATGSGLDVSRVAQSHAEPTPAPPARTPLTTHSASSGQIQAVPDEPEEDDWAPPKPRRTGLWVALGLVVAAGIAGAVVMATGGGGDKTAGPTPSVADAGTIDATPRSPSPVDRHLADAQLKFDARKWADAVVAAKQALVVEGILPADRARAEDIASRAEGELFNRITFDGLVRADEAKDIINVARLYDELPKDSVYKREAEQIFARVRDEWLAPRMKTSESYAARGRGCSTIDGYAKQAKQTFPDRAQDFESLAARCRSKAVAIASKPKPKPKPTPKPTPKKPDPAPPPPMPKPKPKPSPKPAENAKKLVQQATRALRSGQAARALKLVARAWKAAPGDQRAALIGGLAACQSRNAAQARRWHKRLKNNMRKRMVAQVCLRSGIKLP